MTLLPIPGKVLREILIRRIQGGVDHRMRKEKAGFSQGRGAVEQIFILCNILEQFYEWNATCTFSLWRIMRAYGIPDKLIGLVKALYDEIRCAVINEGKIMA